MDARTVFLSSQSPEGLVTYAEDKPSSEEGIRELFREKKAKDLRVVMQALMNYRMQFEFVLPYCIALPHMARDDMQITVSRLSERIGDLIKSVAPLGFPPLSPEVVLRTPHNLYRLAQTIRFSPLVSSEGIPNMETLSGLVTRTHSYFNQVQVVNQQAIVLARRFDPTVEAYLHNAYLEMEGLCQRLQNPPVTPEELFVTLREAASRSTALLDERGRFYTRCIKAIRDQVQYLTNFVDQQELNPKLQILTYHPTFEAEEIWVEKVLDLHNTVLPFFSIVQWVQEFLAPYLRRDITSESEDVHRPELLSWLIPRFRTAYPHAKLSYGAIETIALTAYLRCGSREVNLGVLKAVYQLRTADLEAYGAQHERNMDIEREMAVVTANVAGTAGRILVSYTKALVHALPIDFHSLGLTELEITLLARDFLCHPQEPLRPGWRLTLKKKVETPAPKDTPVYRFPWDDYLP